MYLIEAAHFTLRKLKWLLPTNSFNHLVDLMENIMHFSRLAAKINPSYSLVIKHCRKASISYSLNSLPCISKFF